MVEAVGDSTRDGRWALVRLAVEGERIVSAEAEGLERPLAGLTLLEAAAVGGDELAVDALANALAQVFRAEPKPGRVAVAMSGGVDSAVALLRAGPNAIGVTLRLWLDPQGPDAERACCSPEAVIAARATCHRLGIPHVTLDLREEFRRAVVEPFVRGYAAGETPNPCIRCNGSFRFAELLAFAERAGAERLATGHYARIVERDGRLLLARATDERKDQSYMLAPARPALPRPALVPARRAGQGRDSRRGRARRARGGEPRREPGGLLPRRRRLPRLPRAARARGAGRAGRGRAGQRARPARRLLALHAGPAQGSRRRGGRAALRPAQRASRRTPSSSARVPRSPPTR